ncbi:hypothetical protein CVS27_06510 [Arthrobacter glacialis]|uniref:Uncharacterized protein n=1 Tax=Arthrobacter glacialis TaxID=1664 RepID=A0A2S3ZZ70_ARTGL|nr:hypothetical protein CVS27_06510 [Arthrobacter glacialis]
MCRTSLVGIDFSSVMAVRYALQFKYPPLRYLLLFSAQFLRQEPEVFGARNVFVRASSVHRGLPAKKRHAVLVTFNIGGRTNGAYMARDPARDAE